MIKHRVGVFVAVVVLLLGLHVASVSAANVSFSITANSGSANADEGNFAPGGITVDQGDSVTITFSVPAGDPYCCGAQVKGDGGQFDTGTIAKGGSQMVTFTATSSFNFTSYWPSSGISKASGTVTVNAPTSSPPSTPTGVSATAISQSQIDVTWNAPSGATSYKILRGGVQIGTSTITEYNDNGLSAGTGYSYTIIASNTDGDSGQSAAASATTQSGSGGTTTAQTEQGQEATEQEATDDPNDIFIDTRYDYVQIDGHSWGFAELPETIAIGSELEIYGRTVAGAIVAANFEGSDYTVQAMADENGVWEFEIDGTELGEGEHTMNVVITSGENVKTLDPLTFVLGDETTAQATGTPSEEPENNESSSSTVVVVAAIVVMAVAVGGAAAYLKILRPRRAVKTENN